jgi:heme-degrading monooxygenase HmoA
MTTRRTVEEIPLDRLESAEQPMTVPFEDSFATKVNAQAVEFVAKPGKTDELRGFLCQAVTPLLRDRTGFIRTIVLTMREEPRRVVMITFWNADESTACDPWEEIPQVREILSPLIDVWSRTRAYKGDFTEATEAHSRAASLPIC